jgi:phage protein D
MVASLASSLRQPRAFLTIAGAQLTPIECSVNVSLHQSADTFYAKLPLDNDAGLDETFWADTAPIPITINGTNDVSQGGLTALLVGQVDEPQIDFTNRLVMIKGRDLTAKLTDLKTSEKWQNLSNKDIINQLAGRAGLTVSFSGDTDQSGLQFDQDTNEISDLDACWNVIVACAKHLGCIAFIKGTTLYIQPLDQQASSFFKVNYQRPTPGQIASGNFTTLLCARNLNLAKDASITMKSWQHKQGKTITSKLESKGKGKGTDQSKLLYEFRAPNLTKEQQDRTAKSHLRETLSHERVVTLGNLPGDVTVNPATMGLMLSGTGTAFDQNYIISTVAHHFSFGSGYAMDIGAHNQDGSRGEPTEVQ